MKNKLVTVLLCVSIFAVLIISGCKNVKSPTEPAAIPPVVPSASFTLTPTLEIFTPTITQTNTQEISATTTLTVTQTPTIMTTDTITPTNTETNTSTVTETITLTATVTATVTVTETLPFSGPLIGRAGNFDTFGSTGYLYAGRYQLNSGNVINSSRVYLNTPGTHYRIGIYTDGPMPGTLIAQSPELISAQTGWNSAAFPVTNLNTGSYWICVVSDGEIGLSDEPMGMSRTIANGWTLFSGGLFTDGDMVPFSPGMSEAMAYFEYYGIMPTPTYTATIDPSFISLNKNVTVSSIENSTLLGEYAVDGDTGSRWCSLPIYPAWIYIDLGAIYTVDSINLIWNASPVTDFYVQSSYDANTWTSFITAPGRGSFSTDFFEGLEATGRYFRVLANDSNNAGLGGISLYEFSIYGEPAPEPSATSTPAITPSASSTATATGTATSTPTCQIIFGNPDESNVNAATGGGFTSAASFAASSSTTINSIRIYPANSGPSFNSNFMASIYSDDAGKPGTLLAHTAIFNSNTEVWASAPLVSALSITSGTTYWILVIGESNGMWHYQAAGHSMKYSMFGISWATVQSTGMPSDLSGITWSNLASELKVAAYLCE